MNNNNTLTKACSCIVFTKCQNVTGWLYNIESIVYSLRLYYISTIYTIQRVSVAGNVSSVCMLLYKTNTRNDKGKLFSLERKKTI